MGFMSDVSHVIRKPDFAYHAKKNQISCAVTTMLISTFVFTTRTVQFLSTYSQNFKLPACTVTTQLGLSQACRPVFSRHGSFLMGFMSDMSS